MGIHTIRLKINGSELFVLISRKKLFRLVQKNKSRLEGHEIRGKVQKEEIYMGLTTCRSLATAHKRKCGIKKAP